jgi:hypothetical protein
MVPSIMQQILHDPKLAKLDLSSLASAGAGAAYVSPDLRLAFQRRATKVPFFIEGSNFWFHRWLVLITTLQGTECLKVYYHFACYPYIHGTEYAHHRPLQFSFALIRECLEVASTQYGA